MTNPVAIVASELDRMGADPTWSRAAAIADPVPTRDDILAAWQRSLDGRHDARYDRLSLGPSGPAADPVRPPETDETWNPANDPKVFGDLEGWFRPPETDAAPVGTWRTAFTFRRVDGRWEAVHTDVGPDLTEGAVLWTGRWLAALVLVAAALAAVLLLRRLR